MSAAVKTAPAAAIAKQLQTALNTDKKAAKPTFTIDQIKEGVQRVVRPYPDAKLHARWKRQARESAIDTLKDLSVKMAVARDMAERLEEEGADCAEDYGYWLKLQITDFGTRLEEALHVLGIPHKHFFTNAPEDAHD